ncbi:hypothetical protein ES703_11508 [subsurface metagenome]
MPVRYLEADKVNMQASAPQFVEPGHCHWCNKSLTGKATKFCRPTEEEKKLYRYNYVEPVVSNCNLSFYNWWYSRPAYVRATFIRDNFTCQECGLHTMREDKPWLPDFSRLECDHIVPLARGGKTEMSNLQTLCKECNRKKGVTVPDGEVLPLPTEEEVFRLPNGTPLCGWDWVKEHMNDKLPVLTMTISFNGSTVGEFDSKTRRGAVKRAVKEIHA